MFRNLRSRVAGLVMLGALGLTWTAGKAHADNLVLNGGFESPDIPVIANGAGDNWTVVNPDNDVTRHVVLLDAQTVGYGPAMEGFQFVLIGNNDASGARAGEISQTFATTLGQQYSLTFFAAAVDGQTANATITAPGLSETFSVLYQSNTNLLWEQKSYLFTATESSSTISFANIDAGGSAPCLDDVIVTESVTALPGDVNGDGFVDIFDVNVVSANWGSPGGPTGDANGDGNVDIFDVNLISANWAPPPPPGGGAAVPEPSTMMLFCLGTLAALVYVRVLPKDPV